MKFWIKTLGCKTNFCETRSIVNDLSVNGYKETKNINNSDIIIVNTCTVTKNTDVKIRNLIAEITKRKNKIIFIIGCYCQNYFNHLRKRNDLNVIIGNDGKNKIIPFLQQYLCTKKNIRKYTSNDKLTKFEYQSLPKFDTNTRDFLKIQDGCNQKCSYCIIPYVRGKTRSKDYHIVLKEIEQFVKLGYKEIVLTGINLTSYYSNQHNLYDLLLKIDKIPGNFRIRVSSLEPISISMLHKIIDLFASNQKRWCKQLHLCLQSASNHVLKTMKRPYTIEQYLSLVNYARKKIKNVAITTDYIVGFPSETQSDFNQAIMNLKKIKFANINVFCYSRRKKTLADREYKKDLSQEIIANRLKIINQIKLKYAHAYKEKLIGKKLEVIVQKNKNNVYYGYSSEYVKLLIKDKKNCRRNKLVSIIYQKHNLHEQF